jgi:hypothetical protein
MELTVKSTFFTGDPTIFPSGANSATRVNTNLPQDVASVAPMPRSLSHEPEPLLYLNLRILRCQRREVEDDQPSEEAGVESESSRNKQKMLKTDL